MTTGIMKPTVVLVHGAWHVPAHYETLAHKLKDQDFEVIIPSLPTCGALSTQSDLASDVAVVHKQLVDLVKAGKHVILFPHSYGGAVATQALEGDNLYFSERQKAGLEGGVLHIIYMCAFMLQPGESCFSASQPRPDPDPVEPGDDGTSFLNQPGRDLFYADVDPSLQEKYEGLLVRHSLAALAGPISYPAWQHLPVYYIECLDDMVLFHDWQVRLVEAVKETGKSDFEVETFKSSHSPFLSCPDDMVAIVNKVAARYQ